MPRPQPALHSVTRDGIAQSSAGICGNETRTTTTNASPVASARKHPTVPDCVDQGMVGERSTSVERVCELGDLTVLFESHVNVAVYERALSRELVDDAGQAATMLQGMRLMLTVSAGGERPEQIEQQLGGLRALAADVASLVELLADLTGARLVGVRLAYLESPMCPRLHVDHVTLRLVTTYLGKGTEYGASEDLTRSLLGHAANGLADETSGLIRPGGSIQRAKAGEVVLLKGEGWPGNEGRGAVHRSPFASTLAPRIVLTLDPL